MATCKDCLHYEACKRFNEIRTNVINESKRGAENLCELYADKSRFVELPCKVGDTVLWYSISGEIIEAKIIKNGFCAKIENGFEYDVGYDEIGKTVFLTREEAEAALAERMNE